MKALSLVSPWDQLIVNGAKTIENRKWSTQFRGRFLVHVSKRFSLLDYDEASRLCTDILGVPRCLKAIPQFPRLVHGGFVGLATIGGVVPPRTKDPMPLYPSGVDGRWHFAAQYGFLIRDAQPLTFFPYKGQLGFFDVPDDVYARVLAADKEARHATRKQVST